ncbi:Cyclic lactone autoinducer peptide, partial [Dysosmobacter welbionis]
RALKAPQPRYTASAPFWTAARRASGEPAGASSSGLIPGPSGPGRPASAGGGRPPASARWPRS